METYIDKVTEMVKEKTGLKGKELIKLYSLLVLAKGENVSLEDVHDAWSISMNFKETKPPYCWGHEHKSIVPFDKLPEETKFKDQYYVEQLQKIGKEIYKNKESW